jgi:hypothetical protein
MPKFSRRPDQGERGRHEQRCAKPLADSPRQQERKAGRQPADERPDDENSGSHTESAFPAAPIGQSAAGEQQGRENDVVRVHDPLQAGDGRVVARFDGGQGDVDDGGVQDYREEAEAHGDQRQRSVGGGRGSRRAIGHDHSSRVTI